MSRLIVVSNRVASSTDGGCSGGLAVALEAALSERGGIWHGWSGRIADHGDGPARSTGNPRSRGSGGFAVATIDLSRREYRGYYEGHANRALWPLFHERPDLARFDRESYQVYREVNRRIAGAVAASLAGDEIIWVHDYHMIPLGAELRRLGVTGPIGFFLHVPFPSPGLLAELPWHRELLGDLAGYDLIGFQTRDCLDNFRKAMERRAGASQTRGSACAVAAGHFPIGIDTRAFAASAGSAPVRRRTASFEASRGDRLWAVGAERLDYTKGLAERLLAFQVLLERSPELRGALTLMQIAAPSRMSIREYRDLETELETLSGRINARLGTLDWTPIHYLHRSMTRLQLAALFRVSRIGLVTSLRDGMNLVAKEYVAAQDPGDPGVLILSRQAGAAEELTDALLVDPHDIETIVTALESALRMPADERLGRWTSMFRHLERNDVHRWRRSFLDALVAAHAPSSTVGAVA